MASLDVQPQPKGFPDHFVGFSGAFAPKFASQTHRVRFHNSTVAIARFVPNPNGSTVSGTSVHQNSSITLFGCRSSLVRLTFSGKRPHFDLELRRCCVSKFAFVVTGSCQNRVANNHVPSVRCRAFLNRKRFLFALFYPIMPHFVTSIVNFRIATV